MLCNRIWYIPIAYALTEVILYLVPLSVKGCEKKVENIGQGSATHEDSYQAIWNLYWNWNLSSIKIRKSSLLKISLQNR